MMVIFYWTAVILIFYTYFGYPLLIALMSVLYGKIVAKQWIYPRISLIIAAHNEEKDIAKKLRDSLNLDYPQDKYEIVVVSDGSTDNTNDIVRNFQDSGIRLLALPERKGKTSAQNEAVKSAKGDILIFSDATTVFQKDTIKQMVSNFADNNVGGVGAELIYVNKNKTATGEGTGLYWKYEKFLRKKESEVSSLIGVSGCAYAIRKSLYEEIDTSLISDFVAAQMIYSKGKRVVFESEAIVYEETNSKIKDEFKMRVRVATRSLYGLWYMRKLLNPFKYGMYAVQLISHKLLRYLMPLFLVFLFLTNIVLLVKGFGYRVFLLVQIVFYLSALIQGVTKYFCTMQIALLMALVNFLHGEKNVLWKPQR
ncbi:MAG: glycosyltransferase family 2 protein [bacterium]|nr:glycosyltransferase family 2 protein [bacterium]